MKNNRPTVIENMTEQYRNYLKNRETVEVQEYIVLSMEETEHADQREQ